MTRVGNIEQVMLLLREQLQRSTRARGPDRKGTERIDVATPRPLDRVRALAAFEDLPEDEMRRAVVRGMLTEEFGDAIGTDAAFTRLVDDIVHAIETLPGGPELMAQAIAQLKGQS